MTQVFRHLKADEPAADDSGALHALLAHERADAVGIRHRPERLHAGGVDPGDRRFERRGAGGDHQHVVGFRIGFAGVHALDQHGLLLAVDGEDFVLYADVNAKLRPHRFRRLQQQRRAGFNHVAHVIR
ncbi:hypothetical protein SDC9_169870 [bioreactor metagenome]|uniref:Uncharacterized protein n=1 Tax=bioreactor metagenome TaxID=1076179 RepID=A0A645G6G4_9ZZZZ